MADKSTESMKNNHKAENHNNDAHLLADLRELSVRARDHIHRTQELLSGMLRLENRIVDIERRVQMGQVEIPKILPVAYPLDANKWNKRLGIEED